MLVQLFAHAKSFFIVQDHDSSVYLLTSVKQIFLYIHVFYTKHFVKILWKYRCFHNHFLMSRSIAIVAVDPFFLTNFFDVNLEKFRFQDDESFFLVIS